MVTDMINSATISVLVQAAGLAIIAWLQKSADLKLDDARNKSEAKHEAEAKWRDDVDKIMREHGEMLKSVANDRTDWYSWRALMIKQMESQDNRIMSVLQAQCTQMRSDIIHKCHRYLDDLGRASTEEKEALKAEHDEYSAMCEANDIVNNFVNMMVQRVMELPEREV